MKKKSFKNKKRSDVRVDKLPYRWDPTPGPKTWPVVPGYKNINVCSGSRGIFRNLSPMLLGPIPDVGVQKLENLWQFSKVIESELDDNGDPGMVFLARREEGFSRPKGIRRKSDKSPVKFFYWEGEKLDLVEARKQIYCRYYEQLVEKTDAYRALEQLIKDDINIQILGYDGREYDSKSDPDGSQLNDLL